MSIVVAAGRAKQTVNTQVNVHVRSHTSDVTRISLYKVLYYGITRTIFFFFFSSRNHFFLTHFWMSVARNIHSCLQWLTAIPWGGKCGSLKVLLVVALLLSSCDWHLCTQSSWAPSFCHHRLTSLQFCQPAVVWISVNLLLLNKSELLSACLLSSYRLSIDPVCTYVGRSPSATCKRSHYWIFLLEHAMSLSSLWRKLLFVWANTVQCTYYQW